MSKRQRDTDKDEDPQFIGTKRKKMEDGPHATELDYSDFTVGWLCALPKEQTAAMAMLDQIYPRLPKPQDDSNSYTLGSIGKHNIVIACLPKGKIGTNPMAVCATQMVRTFPFIKVGLMVGIGGGIPPKVRLGDVVVSTPTGQYPGVVQWDFGKAENGNKFKRTGALNNPPSSLLTALTTLETDHAMVGSRIPEYLEELRQKWPKLVPKYIRSESLKDPMSTSDTSDRDTDEMCVHYGLVASGNQVIKDAEFRDKLNESFGGEVLCVEMEAAGLVEFPCIVIRGICDYADAHKNKDWQEHAAAVAAAFAKELLQYVEPDEVSREHPIKDVLDVLKQVHNDVSIAQEDVTHIKSKLIKHEDLEIINWLSGVNYGSQQSDFLARRQPGTGQWLLESSEFQHWLATGKQTLFCPGIPGAGKTILTSVVVDFLTSKFRNDSNTGIAYIYCNFKRQDEQKADSLLISILQQLALCQPSLPQSVKSLYDEHKTKRTRPSINEIIQALHHVMMAYSKTFIIIDALDECQASGSCRTKLLVELRNLQEKHGTNILATSRFIPEITDYFKTNVSLEIRASSQDITRYLEDQIQILPYLVQQDQKLQREITTGISEAVDGMFLLAKLYLDLLADKLTRNDVKNAIKFFQRQGQTQENNNVEIIDKAYEQAMERINSQMKGKKELALKVLAWVTHAKRQLTTLELQHALAIKVGESRLDEGDLPHVGDMISVCAGLITVDQESDIVRLVHYTTQEYFMRSEWFPNAESTITITCITYLSFTVFETGSCPKGDDFKERLRSNPFYEYTSHNWGHHARNDRDSSEQIISFLNSGPKVEASFEWLENRYQRGFNSSQQTARMTGLQLAAFFGILKAVDALLCCGHNSNSRSVDASMAQLYAAQNGYGAVVQRLLAGGVNVNFDNNGRTALQEAAKGGHNQVVQLLLAEGADVNAVDNEGKTVLQEAAKGGYKLIVDLLLAAGADVSAVDMHGRMALQQAAKGGHKSVVDRLLAAGADVNATGGGRSSGGALKEAAGGGHCEIVEMLLARGADVDAISGLSDEPAALQSSTKSEIIKALKRIILLGVNFNAKNNSFIGWTALQAAAGGGHCEVVKMLLAAGADINATSSSVYGVTVLQAAAGGGHCEIVKMLLARGANVNATSGPISGETALQSAARGGYGEIVQVLLEAGADINYTSMWYEATALQTAVKGGYQKIVDMLVMAGANVSS